MNQNNLKRIPKAGFKKRYKSNKYNNNKKRHQGELNYFQREYKNTAG